MNPGGGAILDPIAHSRLLAELAEVSRAAPIRRKLLVCPHSAAGQVMLRALVLAGENWLNFATTSPVDLAAELLTGELAANGLEVADEFQLRALLDIAIDSAPVPLPDTWLDLMDASGFRDALAGAILELRLAGVTAALIDGNGIADPAKRAILAGLLTRYEAVLAEAGAVDVAWLYGRAADALASGEARLHAGDAVFLLPGVQCTGLAGRFLASLQDSGARILSTDPVVGLAPPPSELWSDAEATSPFSYLNDTGRAPAPPPAVAFFHAASPADELREVLRRVMSGGHRWDEVEIVATDADVYGAALHALAARLRIPVTFAAGVPIERTRPGRAVRRYLEWVGDGYPAHVLIDLFHAGDLAPPGALADSVTASGLARRLRRLRVGWDRDRYDAAIAGALAALGGGTGPVDEDGEVTATVEEQDRRRSQLTALQHFVGHVLAATPTDGVDRATTAALAAGARAFLDWVPTRSATDGAARMALVDRLDRIAAVRHRPIGLRAAVAELGAELEMRVAASDTDDAGGQLAEGGTLHLTTVESGGLAGRRVTFVVGLDAGHEVGTTIQHPILNDADRAALVAAGVDARALPVSADRSHASRHGVAALLARLRGRVTLSFSSWDASESRQVAPGPVLLQALRLRDADPSADYERLHMALGCTACALPHGSGRLDALDVWLSEIGTSGVFRIGTDVVRSAFPGLDAGLRAWSARRTKEFNEHVGRITPWPERLDPRRNPRLVLSANRLVKLGACPLRYFYDSVLGVRPPDDPEFDPETWLDALARGSLLHEVFELSLRRARERGVEGDDDAFRAIALETVRECAARMRDHVPVPGEGVYARELGALENDVLVFVAAGRDRHRWLGLESSFGFDDAAPAMVRLPSGREIAIRGRIDRVDALPDGSLVVIDYKSGSDRDYGPSPFRGARRLQHVLYSEVAAAHFGRPVARAEYRFPTVKGNNHVSGYEMGELSNGLALVDDLLDLVAAGTFYPTDDPKTDCGFCDFQKVCRVVTNSFHDVEKAPAILLGVTKKKAKGKEEGDESGPLARLRDLRGEYA